MDCQNITHTRARIYRRRKEKQFTLTSSTTDCDSRQYRYRENMGVRKKISTLRGGVGSGAPTASFCCNNSESNSNPPTYLLTNVILSNPRLYTVSENRLR